MLSNFDPDREQRLLLTHFLPPPPEDPNPFLRFLRWLQHILRMSCIICGLVCALMVGSFAVWFCYRAFIALQHHLDRHFF